MSSFNTPELPAVGFAADLEDEDRLLLGSYGEFMAIEDGTTIIDEGSEQDYLYLLISGTLHATRKEDGHEFLLGRINTGESFGEINIFDPELASGSVVARSFCQVWRINRPSLGEFMAAYPEAAGNLLVSLSTLLSKRVRALIKSLVQAKQSQFEVASLL